MVGGRFRIVGHHVQHGYRPCASCTKDAHFAWPAPHHSRQILRTWRQHPGGGGCLNAGHARGKLPAASRELCGRAMMIALHQVRAVTLTDQMEIAGHVGADPDRQLMRAGINPSALQDPEARIAARQVVGLIDEAVKLSGCDCFGMLMQSARRQGCRRAVPTPRLPDPPRGRHGVTFWPARSAARRRRGCPSLPRAASRSSPRRQRGCAAPP